MEKMGWSKGSGLGREEQGIKEHLTVKFKDDSKGNWLSVSVVTPFMKYVVKVKVK